MKHSSLFLVWIALACVLCAKTNNYPSDQCTWYAAKRFNAVAPEPGVNWGGNACKWFNNAADSGWEIHTSPTSAIPGAIIVWADGMGNLGHVAFVTQVSKDKRQIHIAEKNWQAPGVVTDDKTLVVPDGLRRVAKNGMPYRFLGYIYPKYLGRMSVAPKP